MNYLFKIETGALIMANPHPRHQTPESVIVKSDLIAGAGETLAIVDNVVTVVPRPAKVPVVPASVTRRQFFLELDAQGIEGVLDGFVALADRPTQIEYATAATFDRVWPALNAAIPLLNAFDTSRTWDDAFVDALFIGAGKR